MNASPRPMYLELSDFDQEKLEAVLEKFERSWTPESLPRWMDQWPEELDRLRLPALVEMVKIDLEHRWRVGEPRKLEFYLNNHPELGTPSSVSGELIAAEIEVVRQHGERANLLDYQSRFPGRDAELSGWLLPEGSVLKAKDAALKDTAGTLQATPLVVGAGVASVSLPEHFGRYRILKPIGEGGMGSVFLAHDTELNRNVALKVPHFVKGANAEVLERFQREARSAATLQHPNVCPVYDVGALDATHYISMAYIRGRCLSDYISKGKPLSQRSAALIVRKLALTLDYAHKQGIIHRDLKPANIMVDEHKQPIVMDFGLARKIKQSEESRVTSTGVMLGSPAYMSPEQIQADSEQVSASSDIYSLGVVFYELLTGEVPFQGNVLAVATKILNEDPRRPSEIRDGIDPQLEAICLKMMAKKIEDRYSTAKEAADAISNFFKSGQSPASSHASTSAIIDLEEMEALRGLEARVKSGGLGASQTSEIAVGHLKSAARGFLWQKWFHLAAVAIAALVFGVIIILNTPKGSLQIEVADPKLKVIIDKESFTVHDLKSPLAVRTGMHTILVESNGKKFAPGDALTVGPDKSEQRLVVKLNGLELKGETFEVHSGEDLALKISWMEQNPSVKTIKSKALSGPSGKDQFALRFHGGWPASPETGKNHLRVSNFEYDGHHPLTLEAIVTPTEYPQSNVTSVVLSNEKFREAGLTLALEDGTFHWRFVADPKTKVFARSEQKVVLHRTYHLAAVLEGDYARFYVDGKLQGTAHHLRGPLVASPFPLLIGNMPNSKSSSHGFGFGGWIHGVRVSPIARYQDDFAPPKTLESDANAVLALALEEGEGESVTDSTGNSHNGFIVGATWDVAPKDLPLDQTAAPEPSMANRTALQFSGGQYLKPGYLTLPGDGTFTAEMFVRSFQHVDHKEDFEIVLGCEGNGFALGMGSIEGCGRWTVYDSRGSFPPLVADEPADLFKRTHLAVVFDRGICRLFVNGQQQRGIAKTNYNQLLKPVVGAQIVGDNFRNFFNGLVEQIRFSESARYRRNFAPPEVLERDSTTLALYQLNEGEGNYIYDSSGNSHNLRWENAPWVHPAWAGVEVMDETNLIDPVSFNGHRYAVIDQKLSWEKAGTLCKRLGGQLLIVDSAEEWEFVRTKVLAPGLRGRPWMAFWAGAKEAKPDTWQWLNGSTVDAFWGAGRPDRLQGKEKYSIVIDSWPRWNLNDVPEHLWFPSVCEWDRAPSAEELSLLQSLPHREQYFEFPKSPSLWKPRVKLRAFAPGGEAPFEIQNVHGGVRITPERGTLPTIITVDSTTPKMCEYSFDLVNPETGDRRDVSGVLFPNPWKVKYFSWTGYNSPNPEQWKQITTQKPLLETEYDELRFRWGGKAPAEGVPADRFGIVAETEIPLARGKYEIWANADYVVRVYLDDELIIDEGSSDQDVRIFLDEGNHRLRVEYHEITGHAHLNVGFRRVSSDFFPSEWTVKCYRRIHRANSAPSVEEWEQITDSEPLEVLKSKHLQFDWGHRSEGSPTDYVPVDYFALVAESKVNLPKGRYRLKTCADDGIRVFVDDRKVHDVWKYPGRFYANSEPFELTAGVHDIRVEYFETHGAALLNLELERLK